MNLDTSIKLIFNNIINNFIRSQIMFVCLFVFNVPSTARSFRDGTPIYSPLRKDVKLDKYTVPTGNRTPGRRMAVHYVTAEPRKLHLTNYHMSI